MKILTVDRLTDRLRYDFHCIEDYIKYFRHGTRI